MKKLLLIGLLLGVSWYYFIGGRQLDEQLVRNYYQQQMIGTLSRDPEALCAQLHSDFKSHETVSIAGQRTSAEADKEKACESVRELYAQIEKIGTALGGMATLDYSHEILDLKVASDGKTATVSTKFYLEIAGAVMQIHGTSTDTLIRRGGRVLMLKTESKSRILSG